MSTHQRIEGAVYPRVKISDRFTTRKKLAVWFGRPIGTTVASHELIVRETIALRPGIMLTEISVHVDRKSAQGGHKDLRRLHRPRVGARHHHVDIELTC
jgi:hypothetical protein